LPYRILARIGLVAYRLELSVSSLIHDVFHVSLLKRHVGTTPPASVILPPVSKASTLLLQPEVILDKRIIQKGWYYLRTEILVKWLNAPVEDATWENQWRFSRLYPEFILTDKIIRAGRNDMARIVPYMLRGGKETKTLSWVVVIIYGY